MSSLRVPGVRILATALGLPSLTVIAPSASRAAGDAYVDLSSSASVATNPFLVSGSSTSSAAASIEVAPTILRETSTSSVTLHADARLQQYFRRYSSVDAYDVDLDATRQISERLKLEGGASFRSDTSSAHDVIASQPSVVTPGTSVLPPSDVSYLGQRVRTLTYGARGHATLALSPNSTAELEGQFNEFRFHGSGSVHNYRSLTETLSYAQRLSEHTSLQSDVSVEEVNFLGRRAGDAFIVNAYAGIKHQLSEVMSFSLQAGLSSTSVVDVSGARVHSVGFAAEGELCRKTLHSKLCLNGSRSAQPTAIGGITTLTAATLGYERELDADDHLSINASWNRTSPSKTLVGDKPLTWIGARTELTHKVSRPCALFASAQFADIFQSGIKRRADFELVAGLRIRLGEKR